MSESLQNAAHCPSLYVGVLLLPLTGQETGAESISSCHTTQDGDSGHLMPEPSALDVSSIQCEILFL